MPQTLRTYFRPDQRCSQKAQEKAAAKFGGRVVAYTNLDEWFRDSRKGEVMGVPFFHRFASTTDDLRAFRDRLEKSGIVVLEIDTGRRTDNPKHYADMNDEARDVYGQTRLSKAEAAFYGKMGAEKSPVTKARTDRLPNELAEEILNDHVKYPTMKLALKAINNATDGRGKKFKRKWNASHVSREAGRGKLNLKHRRSGPKVKR